MNGTRTVVILVGLLLIVGAGALGTWLGGRVERAASPSLSPPAEETAAGTPESPAAPEATPEASPEATAPPPPPPPSPAPTPTPTPEARPSLTLGSVPSTVRSDAPVVIQWQIDGPPGAKGMSTRLVVALAGSASVKSSTVASFALPAHFEATVHPRAAGELTITAEATVNGQVLRAEQRLRVE